jgi:hypothetical protein
MKAHHLVVLSILLVSAFLVATVQAQQNSPEASSATSAQTQDAPSENPAQTQGNEHVIEGTVVSMTSHTLVVQTGDNQYLFTYAADAVPNERVKPGDRVRVNGGVPNAEGTRVAENVTVIQPGSEPASSRPGAQEATPPLQGTQVTKEIEYEARRFHVGGRIGAGFSPQLFMFGPQAQFGPFFNRHLMFQPNVEFGFGEVTYMFAVNGEAAYRFGTTFHGQWTPYFGAGPSFNFVNHAASTSTVCFCDFAYKAGFNVFVGAQKRHAFVEMKTALWSAQAPVLRLYIGYNF